MTFLTPWAAFLALLVAAPLAAFVVAERRRQRVGALLRLPEPSQRLAPAVAVTAVAALLGAAAAQPTLVRHAEQRVRTDAQAWFVLDTSLSMKAAEAPRAPSRFQRAQRLAQRLRSALRDVPVGLASITDRAMPHLFPSADIDTFDVTVRKVMGIERPPPTDGLSVLITTLGSLARIASDNFFSDSAKHRLMVVFTDGETKPFTDTGLVTLFQRPPGVHTIFVRLWHADERVYLNGQVDPLYLPDPSGEAYLGELASATGGVYLEEGDYSAIADAARKAVGAGPTHVLAREQRRLAVAPWVAAFAFLPLSFLLFRRNL
jgi:von Willebrand factor type A domain